MRIVRMVCLAAAMFCLLSSHTSGFLPSAWVYYTWPWAYSPQTTSWYYMTSDGWCYNLTAGQWSRLGEAEVVGTWSGTYNSTSGMGNGSITITFNPGGTLSGHNTGTTSGDFTGAWVQNGDTVSGTAGQAQFTARISGNTLTGSMTFGSQDATLAMTRQ
ncbi:hypothetical protein ACFLSJ_01470 [Verrucomicrobiota bacterium]